MSKRALLALRLAATLLGVTAMAGCTKEASPEGPAPGATASGKADVVGVTVMGDAGGYTFRVTVESPDSGCAQYADWWEVVTTDGKLVYRRILAHSHTDEQPFTRSGGPIAAQPDDKLVVRAHMNPGGYGANAMRGTAATGFTAASLEAGFAAELETQAPLPDGCAF